MTNQNGQKWYTVDNQEIQAHGGMILPYQGRFYWYGENKATENKADAMGHQNVDFIGINCYSSSDLLNWKFEGAALSPSTSSESPLYKGNVIERPRVLYSEKTKKFVMWFHFDHLDYLYASAGIATSDKPNGPFKLEKIIKPNRKDIRDFTIFTDQGTNYLVHSSDFNKTLYIATLTPDGMDVTGQFGKILVDQEREAPVLFKKNHYYFSITSGTTGWRPNAALYSRSPYLFNPAKLIDNPCMGPNYRTTFNGQGTAVVNYHDQLYILIDHWKRETLKDSGYSLLPIQVDGKEVTINWDRTPLA